MCDHEKKYCPRCQSRFECKVGSILLCQCSAVTLDENEREYLKKNYDDCLCVNCLKEVKASYHQQQFAEKIKNILGTSHH